MGKFTLPRFLIIYFRKIRFLLLMSDINTVLRLLNNINKGLKSVACLLAEDSGGGSTFFTVTRTTAEILVEEAGLTVGSVYRISDRGDSGIFLTAISTTQFSAEGTRRMLVPATYEDSSTDGGNSWHSIWRDTYSPSVGDLMIWNAYVYKNLTGSIGTSPDGDTTNWELIPKDSFSSGEYIEKVFSIVYDFEHDWISEQWDDKGNHIKVDIFYNNYNLNGETTNVAIEQTDWNYLGFYNPLDGDFTFSNNICSNFIKNNIQPDGTLIPIYDNIANDGIYSNSCQEIGGNYVLGEIQTNSNNGFIIGNMLPSSIFLNSNDGDIYANSNLGQIANNSNGSDISLNSNTGSITDCSHSGNITKNANNGQIATVTGTGNLYNNVNNGDIGGTVLAGDLFDVVVNK